jgi:hypothetical protein
VKDQPTHTPAAYRWVRLAVHTAATGQSADAIHALRRKRQWTDGVQCKIGPDGNLYVNPEEYNKWVESQQQNSSARAA